MSSVNMKGIADEIEDGKSLMDSRHLWGGEIKGKSSFQGLASLHSINNNGICTFEKCPD